MADTGKKGNLPTNERKEKDQRPGEEQATNHSGSREASMLPATIDDRWL